MQPYNMFGGKRAWEVSKSTLEGKSMGLMNGGIVMLSIFIICLVAFIISNEVQWAKYKKNNNVS